MIEFLGTVESLPMPDGWFDAILGPGGVLALLLLLFVAMVRQWLVPGPQHKQILKERDEWRALALKGLGKGEELIEIVESK